MAIDPNQYQSVYTFGPESEIDLTLNSEEYINQTGTWSIANGGIAESAIPGIADPRGLWTSISSTTSPSFSLGSGKITNVSPIVADSGGKMCLTGKNADIEINGQSLMRTLQGIEGRLNLLRPNPKLEKEWDQLKELGEQYRRLEAELLEKTRMWDTLKKMPPPEIK